MILDDIAEFVKITTKNLVNAPLISIAIGHAMRERESDFFSGLGETILTVANQPSVSLRKVGAREIQAKFERSVDLSYDQKNNAQFTREFFLVKKATEKYLQQLSAGGEKPDNIYGSFLFALNRKVHVTAEPNTEKEERLFDALQAYFSRQQEIPQDVIDEIKHALDENLYSDVLVRPTVGRVYTGLAMSMSNIMRLVGLDDGSFKAASKFEDAGEAETDTVLNPSKNKTVSMWTDDAGLALRTAETKTREQWPFAVVVSALTAENKHLIDCNDMLFAMFKTPTKKYNILALGAVKIAAIEWSLDDLAAMHNK